jgi:hypothetical protein
VIVVDHDMSVAAASDWVIDIRPGAGDEGGKVVAAGEPRNIVMSRAGAVKLIAKTRQTKFAAPMLRLIPRQIFVARYGSASHKAGFTSIT